MKQSNVIKSCVALIITGMLCFFAQKLVWSLWVFGDEAWQGFPVLVSVRLEEIRQAPVTMAVLFAILMTILLLERSTTRNVRRSVTGLMTVCGVLCTVACLPPLFNDSLKLLAFTAGSFGAYEIGERIFNIVRNRSDRETGTSLCSLKLSAPARIAGNKFFEGIVGSVYGTHSREMAEEYQTLAGYSAKQKDFLMAELCYEKSARLYDELHADAATAEALGATSWYQIMRGNLPSGRVSLNRAIDLLSTCPDDAGTMFALTWPSQAAGVIGDPGQQKFLQLKAARIKSKLTSQQI